MHNEWQHLFTHDCSCGVRITANVLGSRHSITIGRARLESDVDTDRFFWLPDEKALKEVEDGLRIVHSKIFEFQKDLKDQFEKERQKHSGEKRKFEEPKPKLGLSLLGRKDAEKHGEEAVANYDQRHGKQKKR